MPTTTPQEGLGPSGPRAMPPRSKPTTRLSTRTHGGFSASRTATPALAAPAASRFPVTKPDEAQLHPARPSDWHSTVLPHRLALHVKWVRGQVVVDAFTSAPSLRASASGASLAAALEQVGQALEAAMAAEKEALH